MRNAYVTGDVQLDKMLENVGSKIGDTAILAGIKAGMVVARRAIASQVPKAKLRKYIGQKVKKVRKGFLLAKVGAAVAKKEAAFDLNVTRKKGGLGISARNIHWYIMGTGQRWAGKSAQKQERGKGFLTGLKYQAKKLLGKTTTLKNRGKMPASNSVRKGWTGSQSQVISAIQTKTREVLDREFTKVASQVKAVNNGLPQV